MYIKVPWHAEKRGLKLNMGTLRHIGELISKHPEKFNTKTDSLSAAYNYVKLIVWAGLLSNADSKKEELELTERDIDLAIGEWGPAETKVVTESFEQAFAIEKKGSPEGAENTQDFTAVGT